MNYKQRLQFYFLINESPKNHWHCSNELLFENETHHDITIKGDEDNPSSINDAVRQVLDMLTKTPNVIFFSVRSSWVEQTWYLYFKKFKYYLILWNDLLKTGGPNQCSVDRIHDPVELKTMNEHKFNYYFQSCFNPLYNWSLEFESTT